MVAFKPRPPDFEFYEEREAFIDCHRVWLEEGRAVYKLSTFNGARWKLHRRVIMDRLEGKGNPDYRGALPGPHVYPSGLLTYELTLNHYEAVLKVWGPDWKLRESITLKRRR